MKHAGSNHCYKPFAIIVEDLDQDGKVLSSVPLTFFGQVVPEVSPCPGEVDEAALSIGDIEAVLLENVISEPISPSAAALKETRENRVNLSARLLKRFFFKCESPSAAAVQGTMFNTFFEILLTFKGLQAGNEILKEAKNAQK